MKEHGLRILLAHLEEAKPVVAAPTEPRLPTGALPSSPRPPPPAVCLFRHLGLCVLSPALISSASAARFCMYGLCVLSPISSRLSGPFYAHFSLVCCWHGFIFPQFHNKVLHRGRGDLPPEKPSGAELCPKWTQRAGASLHLCARTESIPSTNIQNTMQSMKRFLTLMPNPGACSTSPTMQLIYPHLHTRHNRIHSLPKRV